MNTLSRGDDSVLRISEDSTVCGLQAGGQSDLKPVPIIVVVYHREDDTRRMFEQLERVTSDYSLIVVNNGFEDPAYIRGLDTLQYIENEKNVGVIQAINQGLEVADGRYIAVLHSDVFIYEEGWLGRIVDFMDRRPDVGLVGLMGMHTICRDGSYSPEDVVANHRGLRCRESNRPTWRFTEVATIDGVGWVMRNMGLRLDEDLGLMHCYDLDLSLQYIEHGQSVYTMACDLLHLCEDPRYSSRLETEYLERIGGDDDVYYARVRDKLSRKWNRLLPITRGFRDESYAIRRIDELESEVGAYTNEAAKSIGYIDRLEKERKAKTDELEKVHRYIEQLEVDNIGKAQELKRAGSNIRQLEQAVSKKIREDG